MKLTYSATTKASEVTAQLIEAIALPQVVGVSEKQTEYAKSIIFNGLSKLLHPNFWNLNGGEVETAENFDAMLPVITQIIESGAGKVIENKSSFEGLAKNKSLLIKK
jgi:hypothetical protein